MLVLTRRECEKVLFPALGISVEVVRTNPSNVKLGIDAPRDIRVVRAELAGLSEMQSSTAPVDAKTADQIREQLEQAKMAISLAQNQLRQGLVEHAELALDDAFSCLNDLNELAERRTQTVDRLIDEPPLSNSGAVKESAASYELSGVPTIAALVDDIFG